MMWASENKYDEIIAKKASKYNVPVALVKAVMAKESSFNPKAYKAEPQIDDASRGLMQVLFRTAKNLGFKGASPDMLFDPGINIEFGTALLADNLKRTGGKVDAAVAAYNAGWSKVRPNDAPRKPDNTYVNQSYVDDVNVYYAYFAGKVTDKEVKEYAKSKNWIGGTLPVFF